MSEMEEIIKKEISQISGLQERVVFKDIIEQIFLSLYETNQEMYRELESRIMDDLAFDINRYRICTGVTEREYVDRSHHLLFPMREEDLEEKVWTIGEIMEEIREKGKCRIKTYFMECDYLHIRKLLERQKLSGVLQTQQGEYAVEYELAFHKDYLQEIRHLYEVFISNGISWQTVNTPYLYKYVDVYLTGLPEEAEWTQVVTGIQPAWEEYSSLVHDNYVPIWNIRKLRMDSVGFPVPCENHRGYEHTISIREYGNEHVYLIDDREHIYSVRQRENRLIVMGKESEARKWQVYTIRCGENRRFDRFTYPLMTNQRKDEFIERFRRQQGMKVRTNAELARFIKGFGMEEYVEYEGFEWKERSTQAAETYSMNSFILDEIREKEYKRCLVLRFRGKGRQTFLLRDIMSFLVSEVQLLYGEYRCEGILV